MANNRWIGAAQLTAQAGTFTITADDATTTYKVTINNKVVSVTGSGVSTAQTAANLQAALAASQVPEFQAVVWTVSTNVVTGTARIAGTPFGPPVTSVSGGVGTIGAWTQTVANSSPNDVNNALNWSLGAVPVLNNVLFFDQQSTAAWWNLSALSGVSVAGINITSTFSAEIGLPEINTSQGTPYEEYYTRYFTITTTAPVNIGKDDGSGSTMIQLNLQASAVAVNVYSTGGSVQFTGEALILLGSALTQVNVFAGSVGCALLGSETSSIGTLNVGTSGGSANTRFRGGAGLTVTTLNQISGTVLLSAAPGTVTMLSGTCTIAAGTPATVTITGGTLVYEGDGSAITITNLTIGPAGVLDLSQGQGTVTVTNAMTLFPGAQILDPKKRLAVNTSFSVSDSNLLSCSLDFGPGRSYQITA